MGTYLEMMGNGLMIRVWVTRGSHTEKSLRSVYDDSLCSYKYLFLILAFDLFKIIWDSLFLASFGKEH